MRYLLLLAPFIVLGLSVLPKIIIQWRDTRLDDEAISSFRAYVDGTTDVPRELTFEERWDAADDEFMRTWSSFCSRDLVTEYERLVERFAEDAERVIQRTADQMRWTYDHLATHFIRVDTTIELGVAYLLMKADGVDFDVLRERVDPMDDTAIWTEEMERELRTLLDVETVRM